MRNLGFSSKITIFSRSHSNRGLTWCPKNRQITPHTRLSLSGLGPLESDPDLSFLWRRINGKTVDLPPLYATSRRKSFELGRIKKSQFRFLCTLRQAYFLHRVGMQDWNQSWLVFFHWRRKKSELESLFYRDERVRIVNHILSICRNSARRATQRLARSGKNVSLITMLVERWEVLILLMRPEERDREKERKLFIKTYNE